MNRDFSDMLSALSAAGAEYLIVGAHAMAAHGRPRATGDLDIWVNPRSDNARKVWSALAKFGAPMGELTLTDLSNSAVVFQMGVPPNRIDILTSIDGVEFDSAWSRRIEAAFGGQHVPVLGRNDLLINKKAAGRPKDLADAAWLEAEVGGE
jgi:hypothetical protein